MQHCVLCVCVCHSVVHVDVWCEDSQFHAEIDDYMYLGACVASCFKALAVSLNFQSSPLISGLITLVM